MNKNNSTFSQRGVINLSDKSVSEPSQENVNLSLSPKNQYELGTFISEMPQSKKFFSETYIDEDGKIHKGVFTLNQEQAWFQDSIYKTKKFSSMYEFATFVQESATCNHYFTTGVFSDSEEYSKVIATSNKELKNKQELNSDKVKVISRTQNFITGQNKPGIVCIDVDMFKGRNLTLEETLDMLLRAIPELKEAPMVIFPSTGSNIYGRVGKEVESWVDKDGNEIENDDFGNCKLRGINGFHIFIGVQSTNWLTAKLFERINQRMWLEGGGFIKISANGNMLERCLIDTSVLKPVQPIYTYANIGDSRLYQKLGEPWLINPNAKPFNLRNINKLTPDEEVRYLSLVAEEKELSQEEAERTRKEWAYKQAERTTIAQNAKEKGTSGYKLSLKALADEYMNTAVNKVLSGQQEVYITPLIRKETGKLLTTDIKKDEHGTEYIVRTIEQLLENPELYHGARCACIEDLYYAPGGKKASKIDYTRSRIYIKHEPFPRIHDFAHGGVNYRLLRDKTVIELATDMFDVNIDDILSELRKRNTIFKKGTVPYKLLLDESDNLQLVQIKGDNLKYILCQNFSFFEFSKKNERYEVLPYGKLVDTLLSEFCIRNQCNTKGVTTIPYLDISGHLRVKKGYDPSTGFIYDEKYDGFRALERRRSADDWRKIDDILADMKEALKAVEGPIRLFKFKDQISAANMLSAMLTTVLKQWFNNDKSEMYPGFTTDGPGFGLGKSKLLQILGVLLKGEIPSASTIEGDAGEIKKEIGSKFISGSDFFFFDNVDKRINSATLASLLTSKKVAFRVLGESKEAEFRNSCFVTASGKNIEPSSELKRRLLNIRIEPVEVNYLNHKFDFEPVEYTLDNRYKIIEGLMTLYIGYKEIIRLVSLGVEGSEKYTDFEDKVEVLGSFETWSKNIGGCIKFVGEYIADRDGPIVNFGDDGSVKRAVKYGMPGGNINDIFKEEVESDMESFYRFMAILCKYYEKELVDRANGYEEIEQKDGIKYKRKFREGNTLRFVWKDLEKVMKGEEDSALKAWLLSKKCVNGRNFSAKVKGYLGNIFEFKAKDGQILPIRFSSNNNRKKIYYLSIEK